MRGTGYGVDIGAAHGGAAEPAAEPRAVTPPPVAVLLTSAMPSLALSDKLLGRLANSGSALYNFTFCFVNRAAEMFFESFGADRARSQLSLCTTYSPTSYQNREHIRYLFF
jgi:hypothetical protein